MKFNLFLVAAAVVSALVASALFVHTFILPLTASPAAITIATPTTRSDSTPSPSVTVTRLSSSSPPQSVSTPAAAAAVHLSDVDRESLFASLPKRFVFNTGDEQQHISSTMKRHNQVQDATKQLSASELLDMVETGEISASQAQSLLMAQTNNPAAATMPQMQNERTTMEDPIVIPLGNPQVVDAGRGRTHRMHRAYQHVFHNLHPDTTSFVAYPYKFQHISRSAALPNETFPEGAVLKTRLAGLPGNVPHPHSQYYFTYLRSKGVKLWKAKGMYLGNIGILRLEGKFKGRFRDLTYESSYMCTSLYAYIGKWAQCFRTWDWERYLQDPRHEDASIVYLNATDIGRDYLLERTPNATASEIRPRFGMLLVPDIVLGAEDMVHDMLGALGQQNLRDYVQHGGVIYASGKSALLLEKLGILTAGTVDHNTLVKSRSNRIVVDTHCDGVSSPDDGQDFNHRLACMGLVREQVTSPHNSSLSGSRVTQYLLSSHPVRTDVDPGLQSLMSMSPSWNQLYTTALNDGNSEHDVDPNSVSTFPMMLRKEMGKGTVLLNLAHSVTYSDRYFPLFYNSIFMAMSRNMRVEKHAYHSIDSPWVESRDYFPGLEADIELSSTYELYNMYDQPSIDAKLQIWVPKGLRIVRIPEEHCTNVTLNTSDPAIRDHRYVTYAFAFECTFQTIAPFSRVELSLNLEVVDAMFTRRMRNVPVSFARFHYTNAATTMRHEMTVGFTYIQAFMAALLRSDYNIDPSAFYPLPCKGVEIDPVLTAMNKEHTQAYDVEHIAIAPLVSPMLDGSDQARLIKVLEFFDRYYKEEFNGVGDYKYPFKKGSFQHDYVDYKLLSELSAHLDAEWDIPVKVTDLTRNNLTARFPSVPDHADDPDSVGNAQYNYDVNSINLVLNQTNFDRHNTFFEHAVPRQMAFLDASHPRSAAALWQGNIPADKVNPRLPDRARTHIVLSRTDIFFDEAYPLPLGLDNSSIVITVDRYADNSACRADGKSVTVEDGYFSDTQPGGLKPDECSNAKTKECNVTTVHFDQIEAVSGGKIRRIHYLMPLDQFDDIQEATDLQYFNADGRVEGYPDTSFIKAMSGSFLLNPAVSRLGGYWSYQLPQELQFPIGVDPIADNLINYAVDHVAVRSSTYDSSTRTVKTYFHRGNMPNERYGKPSVMALTVHGFEWNGDATQLPHNFTLSLDIYTMSWSFADPNGFERTRKSAVIEGVQLFRKPFLRLPAVEMRFRRNLEHRGISESIIKPYENLQPFVRYNLYYQEMIAHRTVWGLAESHLVSNPGLVSSSGGFAGVSTIGISSIPFKEYLTTGVSQVIPFAATNSRLEWKDIWGRKFSQPVRSTFADVPPIPPPLRNFMMTSTFELLDPKTGDRMLWWPSDQAVDVRVQIKLLNNYPKYFDATTCAENRVMLERGRGSMIYKTDLAQINGVYNYNDTTASDTSQWIGMGRRSKYGLCWDSAGTRLEGRDLLQQDRTKIYNISLCASSIDQCPIPENMPTLHRRPASQPSSGNSDRYNYAPEVDAYYPEGYTNNSQMWDLTHYDYQDSAYYKAYPFHLDNNLPNVDQGIIRPHNIIAAPIWKGLGYKVEYDPSHWNPRFGADHQGWWSDNLQNRDATLLAGQPVSNPVSVVGADLTEEYDLWVPIESLQGEGMPAATEKALRNIYTCKYNRKRIKVSPANPKFAHPKNVYVNNVVPIEPRLNRNDPDLRYHKCDLNEPMYGPLDISKVDNRVRTNSARDWLYFAANLRGGSRETINMLLHIEPFQDVFYEGAAKVYDGGRFVYWNPANGPNSFLVVDNGAQMVHAKRTDIEVQNRPIPHQVTTIDSEFYHIITMQDKAEINRQFRGNSYYNFYGFGDAATHVYVGEDGTSPRLQPGQTVVAKITLMNNAGFDWRMLAHAIVGSEVDQSSLAETDRLESVTSSIRVASEYRFLRFEMDERIRPYIQIEPWTENQGIEPVFFDLENINVVTVRDGFEGNYYVKIHVLANATLDVRGVTWEIQPVLVPEYFESLPGYRDPTAGAAAPNSQDRPHHDYTLEIPAMLIGIPYASSQPYAGRVYYTLGHAHSIDLRMRVPNDIEIVSAKLATDYDVRVMQHRSAMALNPEQLIRWWYENRLPTDLVYTLDNSTLVGVNASSGTCADATGPCSQPLPPVDPDAPDSSNYTDPAPDEPRAFSLQTLSFDFVRSFNMTKFPRPKAIGPDEAKMNIVVRCRAKYLPYGTRAIGSGLQVDYQDFQDRKKHNRDPLDEYFVVARGASLISITKATTVSPQTLETLAFQQLQPNSTNVVRLRLSLTNDGSAIAYRLGATLHIPQGMALLTDVNSDVSKQPTILNMANVTSITAADSNIQHATAVSTYGPLRVKLPRIADALSPGDSAASSIYLAVTTQQVTYDGLAIMDSGSSLAFELTPTVNEHIVEQPLDQGPLITMGVWDTVAVDLQVSVDDNRMATLAVSSAAGDVSYDIARMNFPDSTWAVIGRTSGNVFQDPHLLPKGTRVAYKAFAMQQENEAVEALQVGESPVVSVVSTEALSPILTTFIVAGTLGLIALLIFAWYGKRKHTEYKDTYKGPYQPVRDDPVDKVVARAVNRHSRMTGEGVTLSRLAPNLYSSTRTGHEHQVELHHGKYAFISLTASGGSQIPLNQFLNQPAMVMTEDALQHATATHGSSSRMIHIMESLHQDVHTHHVQDRNLVVVDEHSSSSTALHQQPLATSSAIELHELNAETHYGGDHGHDAGLLHEDHEHSCVTEDNVVYELTPQQKNALLAMKK
jgi:hypothetical protein